jgi:hypothetical protein
VGVEWGWRCMDGIITPAPSPSRWIYFLDVQFTLMIFGLLKLMPIISVHGFNFLSTHIDVIVPIVQMFAFTIVALFIFIYFIDCHYFCESLSIIICWSNEQIYFYGQ